MQKQEIKRQLTISLLANEFVQGATFEHVTKKYGVEPDAISALLKKHNLSKESILEESKTLKRDILEAVLTQNIDITTFSSDLFDVKAVVRNAQNIVKREISMALSHGEACQALAEKYGVRVAPVNEFAATLLTNDQIADEIRSGKSLEHIAQRCKVTKQWISSRMKSAGYDVVALKNEHIRQLITQKELSVFDISKQTGVSLVKIKEFVKKMGVDLPPKKTSRSLRLNKKKEQKGGRPVRAFTARDKKTGRDKQIHLLLNSEIKSSSFALSETKGISLSQFFRDTMIDFIHCNKKLSKKVLQENKPYIDSLLYDDDLILRVSAAERDTIKTYAEKAGLPVSKLLVLSLGAAKGNCSNRSASKEGKQ